MPILIHGDYLLLSRQKLTELISIAKNNLQEIILLDGLKITLTDLIQASESSSFLAKQKTVILENLFSRPDSVIKKILLNYLKATDDSFNLICWEKKEISGHKLRFLPKNWKIIIFKKPALVFKFLDSLAPNNNKEIINLLTSCLNFVNYELLFYLTAQRIRNLIIIKDLGKTGIVSSPWQINKLYWQANKFDLNYLLKIYKQLLNIDIDIKTGRHPMPLAWHLDLWLLNL